MQHSFVTVESASLQCLLLVALLFFAGTAASQVERAEWEIGGGLRLNSMGLDGGFSGTRSSDGYSFDIKYKEIGMDNYATSYSVAIGGDTRSSCSHSAPREDRTPAASP